MIVIHWFGFSFSFLRIKVGLGRNGLSGRPPNVGVLVSKCVLSSFLFFCLFFIIIFFSRFGWTDFIFAGLRSAGRHARVWPSPFSFSFFFLFPFCSSGGHFPNFLYGSALNFCALRVRVLFCFVFYWFAPVGLNRLCMREVRGVSGRVFFLRCVCVGRLETFRWKKKQTNKTNKNGATTTRCNNFKCWRSSTRSRWPSSSRCWTSTRSASRSTSASSCSLSRTSSVNWNSSSDPRVSRDRQDRNPKLQVTRPRNLVPRNEKKTANNRFISMVLLEWFRYIFMEIFPSLTG